MYRDVLWEAACYKHFHGWKSGNYSTMTEHQIISLFWFSSIWPTVVQMCFHGDSSLQIWPPLIVPCSDEWKIPWRKADVNLQETWKESTMVVLNRGCMKRPAKVPSAVVWPLAEIRQQNETISKAVATDMLCGANTHTIIFFSVLNGALSCDVYLVVLTFFIFSNSLSNVTSPGFFILTPYFSAISGFTGDRFENSYLKDYKCVLLDMFRW